MKFELTPLKRNVSEDALLQDLKDVAQKLGVKKLPRGQYDAHGKFCADTFTRRFGSWRMRFLVMRRDDFRCKKCGRSPATDKGIVLHVDHDKAWAKGGETVIENLQTLCSVCNIGKSDLE